MNDVPFAWVVLYGLLALIGVPVLCYLCSFLIAVGRLSGERWFWINHADEIREFEETVARKERDKDEQ